MRQLLTNETHCALMVANRRRNMNNNANKSFARVILLSSDKQTHGRSRVSRGWPCDWLSHQFACFTNTHSIAWFVFEHWEWYTSLIKCFRSQQGFKPRPKTSPLTLQTQETSRVPLRISQNKGRGGQRRLTGLRKCQTGIRVGALESRR